jgi:hypothetical protein
VTISDLTVAAAATGNNASVAPAEPSGLVEGDLVLIFAAIRNSGTGSPNTPSGWTRIGGINNAAVFGRYWQTGDTMPTVTFTGGVANADTYARAMKWRGVATSLDDVTLTTQANASAANIAYPALDVPRDDCALVMMLWKQDDATSLGTPAGWTAQGHTNMTTGDDMLGAWFTQLQTAETDIGASSVTVTGGVSAISNAMMLALKPAAAISVDEQDVYPPRVLVTVTGLAVDDLVEVYREVGGVRTLLRGGSDTATDTSFLVLDAELPFGVPVSYVALVEASEYSTAATTYTLPGGKVALTDAITGLAVEAVVMAWPEKRYDRDASVFRLAGGSTAVASGPMGQFTATLDVFTETNSSRANLQDLLSGATSGVIQLRQSGGYEDFDCYVAVLSHIVRRWSQDGSDARRIFTLEVAEVEAWQSDLVARGYTYADLTAVYDALTYSDLAGDHATYLALAQAELTP